MCTSLTITSAAQLFAFFFADYWIGPQTHKILARGQVKHQLKHSHVLVLKKQL